MISLEKSQEVLRGKLLELERSLDSSRAENLSSQRELAEYRGKARKILEEKEKFIIRLKAGEGHSETQSEMREAEVEQLSRERNLYQEETLSLAAQLQAAREEVASYEERLQREEASQHCLLSDLTRQLTLETERREELESEVSRQAEELRFSREDLTRAKTSSLRALAEKEAEIKKLREQINFRAKLSGHRREEEGR